MILTEGLDLEAFLNESANTQGGMVGSATLVWPDSHEKTLGLIPTARCPDRSARTLATSSPGTDPVVCSSTVLQEMAGSVTGHDVISVNATSQQFGPLVLLFC